MAVFRNVSANLLVLVAQLVGIPQLGLQRHLASKGLPKASKGVPRRSPGRPREAQWLDFPTVGWRSPDFHDLSLQVTKLETSECKN